MNPKNVKKNKIALIWQKFGQFKTLKCDLEKSGFEVEAFSYEELDVNTILSEKYLALIVESSEGFDAYDICDMIRQRNSTLSIFFVIDDLPINCVDKAFAKGYPDHLVRIDMPELSDWIVQNLKKILIKDFSGIEFYSKTTEPSISFTINNSKMKDQYIDQIVTYASNRKVRERVLHTIADILDEMITNALFDAPIDEHGIFLYQKYDRKENLVLSVKQSSVLACQIDESKIFLSIKDPFGSLTKSKLLSYLSKGNSNTKVVVENKKGGAGIGINTIFRLSHNFVINIVSGVFSELIICISMESDILKQDNASLDIFVREK
jgi:hypothetical protein